MNNIKRTKDEEPGLIEIWGCTCFMIISSCKRKVTLENCSIKEKEGKRERQTHTRIYTYIYMYIPVFVEMCVIAMWVWSLCQTQRSLQLFSCSKGKYKIHLKSWELSFIYIKRWIYKNRETEREWEDKERRDKRYPSFPSLINLPTVLVRHHFSSLSFYFFIYFVLWSVYLLTKRIFIF